MLITVYSQPKKCKNGARPKGKTYVTWRENRRNASSLRDSLPDLSSASDEYERNLQLIYEEAQRQHLNIIFINQGAIYSDTMNACEKGFTVDGWYR